MLNVQPRIKLPTQKSKPTPTLSSSVHRCLLTSNIKEEKQQKMKMEIAAHHSQIRRYRPTIGRVKEIPRIIILTVFVVRKFHYWGRVNLNYQGKWILTKFHYWSRVNLNYQGKLIFFYHIWILLTHMFNHIISKIGKHPWILVQTSRKVLQQNKLG